MQAILPRSFVPRMKDSWHIKRICANLLLGEPLKAEVLEAGTFLDIEDARTEIFDYIEIYYNRVRRHLFTKARSLLNQFFTLNLQAYCKP